MSCSACTTANGINSWHVAFVQECNLRCDYCFTGHGAYGASGGVMSAETQALFMERAFALLGGHRVLGLNFGCGETFLHFDAFAAFVERLRAEAARHGVGLSLKVTTNGTRLDDERLEWCLQRDVQLTFSIDGGAGAHDRHRRDVDGDGTHGRALTAWRRYNAMAARFPGAGKARIRTVIAEGERLADAIAFWDNEGVVLFDETIEEPTPFSEAKRRATWDARRRAYLEDLEAHAMASARRTNIPHFMRDYRGPSIILQMWTRLFLGGNSSHCGAGASMMAVDCAGRLFPCDGFQGHGTWQVGTVAHGIDEERLAQFRAALVQQRSHCTGCDVRDLCDGGCAAANPDGSITLNSRGGCKFFPEVAAICRRSYQVLKEQGA